MINPLLFSLFLFQILEECILRIFDSYSLPYEEIKVRYVNHTRCVIREQQGGSLGPLILFFHLFPIKL